MTEAVSQPDFDPDTLLYCLLVDEIFGYLLFAIDAQKPVAHLEFPRMMLGHEQGAEN